MPTATKKRTAKKATKKTAKRTMSSAHKKALAEGRNMSATVDRYLAAINTPKKRGRKVSVGSLRTRLAAAKERAQSTVGVERVLAAQEVRDLRDRLASAEATTTTDIKKLEQDFVKVAKAFSERRGVSYGAWRDAGVPPAALRKAGIARTRG